MTNLRISIGSLQPYNSGTPRINFNIQSLGWELNYICMQIQTMENN